MADASVTAADVAAAEETRQQQAVMRSLRVFVDALRDIKKPDTAPAEMQRAVRALCQAPDERWSEAQCLENAWRTGIVPLLQRLCLCMERLERIEAQQAAKRTAKASADKPKAPVGLLSLRDYSVLQAAIEILLCWAVYPRMESGILTPIERRRPTRTLAISVFVLGWGARGPPPDDDGDDLLRITQVMMHVLYLPQFQPILLPKYTLELLAMVIYGGEVKSGVRVETEAEFKRLRDQMIQTLPLKLAMGSLRAALGQATGRSSAASAFMKRGSRLMSQLSMEDGGVMTIIEILLGGVDEGNTQARIQVATLICQCPSGVEPNTYAKKLCRQVKGLLSASNRASKLLCEMGVVLTDHLASRYPDTVELHLLMPLFDPLLRYETKNYKATGNQATVADEEELSECVTLAHLLVCGPPPSQNLLQILAPIFRPLIHMYAFASNSKSFHRQPIQNILVAWIKLSSWSAIFLQIAVLPVELPDRSSFKTSRKDLQSESQAAALRNEFCAGGNGGIAIRRIAPSNEEEEATIRHNLQAIIEPLVELLTLKNLESVAVVGDLFASLLLTYMDVRTSTRKSRATNSRETLSEKSVLDESLRAYEVAKVPSTPLGVEMVLMLLLSITESLGPAVLRSAETILRCIATVLTTFSGQTTRLVDSVEDTSTLIDATDSLAADDEEESVEMLTICLGVVMTILEAGSTHRSASEEAELKRMLPVLEELSHHPKPDIAELGSEARVRILSRDAVSEDAASKSQKQESFAQVLKRAEDDLKSALVPLRARGVVTLTKLVRASQLHRGEQEWTPRIELLIKIFLRHIEDTESYVFLAAVQGLSTLADIHPDVAIPLLVAALQDQKRQYTLETRIKLSEALLFAAKRCGETLPKYAKVFVYAYLDCIRPTASPKQVKAAAKRVALIQEIPSKTETEASAQSQSPPAPTQTLASAESSGGASQMEEATLRASCLSNLAEVCALLQWSLQPFAVDVITCVVGVLQLELDNAPSEPSIGLTPVKTLTNASASKDDLNASKTESKTSSLPPPAPSPVIAVRRGAVFVLKYLIQLLGWKLLEILPDQLASVYQTLKHVSRTDRDNVVIFHAQGALDALSEVMRAELFPRVEQQDEAFGISSKLRIV